MDKYLAGGERRKPSVQDTTRVELVFTLSLSAVYNFVYVKDELRIPPPADYMPTLGNKSVYILKGETYSLWFLFVSEMYCLCKWDRVWTVR